MRGLRDAITILLFVAALLSGLGCTTVRKYDVSGVLPFDSYAGERITLARDIYVLQDTSSSIEGDFIVTYPTKTEGLAGTTMQQEEITSTLKALFVPAGTGVRVNRILLTNSRNIYTDFWHLNSWISIEGISEEGWPYAVNARFNHSVLARDGFQSPGFGHFGGQIRPAPWEPAGTPLTREFKRPPDLKPLKRP